MDDASSYLVPFRLVPVPVGEWGHSATAQWAEPSVEAAASLMRRVFEAPDEARTMGQIGRRKVLAPILARPRGGRCGVGAGGVSLASSPAERARRRRSIVDASLVLARDPTLVGCSGRGPVALVRRALMRALWPQLADLRRRDDALLQGLSDVERSVAELEERFAAIEDQHIDAPSMLRVS